MGIRLLGLGLLAVCFWAEGPALAAAPAHRIFALISKVEGAGTARVRRTVGTEAVAGERMEIFPGDQIVTDEASTVDVLLHDGTLIRVGLRTEFKFTEAKLSRG